MMIVYSLLLLATLVVGAPYWLVRMATSGRYRAGLAGRLGVVPKGLRAAVAGRDVMWVHAVSVGEVLSAIQLIGRLREALPGWIFAVSTTTQTGQRLAKERLKESPVFYLPLDFQFAVQRYLRVLQPRMLVLMESELWPRLIGECATRGIPIVVDQLPLLRPTDAHVALGDDGDPVPARLQSDRPSLDDRLRPW